LSSVGVTTVPLLNVIGSLVSSFMLARVSTVATVNSFAAGGGEVIGGGVDEVGGVDVAGIELSDPPPQAHIPTEISSRSAVFRVFTGVLL
jgi:hypothetical protein